MPQPFLQGFPDGAIRIGSILSVLKKEGRVTYFVGADNYFSHAETDTAGPRFAMATLLAKRHVRACEVEASSLGIAHRTLLNWTRQLDEKGPGSFYAPRPGRGGAVITPGKSADCGRFLDAGETIAGVVRRGGYRTIGERVLKRVRQRHRTLADPRELVGSSRSFNRVSHGITGGFASGDSMAFGYMLTDTCRRSSARCWSGVGVVRMSKDASAGACFG